ncbi:MULTISPECIES: hypothetical protein [Halorubrum]|uniref:hypothetical protein n=1 Tax=Halorubrum TaxID=56688 RepID=UPI0012677B59|nr:MULTISPECIES: hypothetical protein [Halorubrum]
MNRRTYLLGLAAGTGSAVSVLGTGAFTSVKLSRQVSIEVVPDNQALLALKIPYSGDAIQVDEGKFTIDATKGGNSEGIKAGSTRDFGDWNPSGKVKEPALQVVNKGSQPQAVEFAYSWDSDEIGGSSMKWFLSWQPTGQNKKHFVVDHTREEASITAQYIPPGKAINIAFRVDAGEAGDKLSGEIALESTAVEDEQSSPGNSDK